MRNRTISKKITIGWLYPELMSTYGDRGNIIVLTKRCQWRGINVNVKRIDFQTERQEIESCNLLFGGGAQDRQQRIVIDDLLTNKGPILKKLIEHDTPGLFVCGSPQLLGHYYMTGEGKRLTGLGIFDMESKHFGKDKPRCIGNLVGRISDALCVMSYEEDQTKQIHYPLSHQPITTIVGFENHGGRTYLGKGVIPFANVIRGFGNNGEDGTEGAVYKNCIATYSHGPFLPKNPHIADWLISKALEIKYDKKVMIESLDDTLEWQAHDYILQKFSSSV